MEGSRPALLWWAGNEGEAAGSVLAGLHGGDGRASEAGEGRPGVNLTGKTCGPWRVKSRASWASWMCARAGEEGLTAVHESFLLRLLEIDKQVAQQVRDYAESHVAVVEAVQRRDERKLRESRLRSRQLAVAPAVVEPVRKIVVKKRGPFVLAPLRRFESEPRVADCGHRPGWPKGFDPTGLLGPLNESRALCRSREVAEREAKRAERMEGRQA